MNEHANGIVCVFTLTVLPPKLRRINAIRTKDRQDLVGLTPENSLVRHFFLYLFNPLSLDFEMPVLVSIGVGCFELPDARAYVQVERDVLVTLDNERDGVTLRF